jgi:hypothetical protein
MLEGVNVLIGDQANKTVLESWIETTNGGHFDVIIDDGGHHNCQIKNTFDALWPTLNPGGLYFIEDLFYGHDDSAKSAECDNLVFSDVILDWTEQLMYGSRPESAARKYKRPRGRNAVNFIHCIHEMCVLGKNPPREKS